MTFQALKFWDVTLVSVENNCEKYKHFGKVKDFHMLQKFLQAGGKGMN